MTDYDILARAFPGLREAGGDSAIAILVEGDLAEVLPDWGARLARCLAAGGTPGNAWLNVLVDYDENCKSRDRQRAAEEAEAKRIDDIVCAAVLKQQIAAESAAQPELL